MFNLPAIIALAADTPAASAIDLSPTSVLILLAALGIAYDLKLWTGTGYELTETEIQTINDLIALAEGEIIP